MAPNNLHTTHAPDVFNWVWDDATSEWIKMTPSSGGGGGGAVTIADGADVTQGAKADAAWVSGSGSVVAILKTIAAASGGGANFTTGSIAAGSSLILSTVGQGTLYAVMTAGTGDSIALEGSIDGTNYDVKVPFVSPNYTNGSWTQVNFVGTLNTTGSPYFPQFQANVAGLQKVRVRQTAGTGSTWVLGTTVAALDPPSVISIRGTDGGQLNSDNNGALNVTINNSPLHVDGPGGGPVAVSIADGIDVTQGTKADAAWVFGDGTVISLLKSVGGSSSTTAAFATSTSALPGVDSGLATGVQGITGGVPVTTKITDGVSNAAVKAASTAAVAADPALVVRTVQLPLALAAGGGLKVEGIVGGVAVPVSGAVAVTNAGLTNLDVALSTRTKPADQQHAIIDSGTTVVTQPTGTNLHVVVDSAPVVSGAVTVTGTVTAVPPTVDASGQSPTDAYNLYRLQERNFLATMQQQTALMLMQELSASQRMGFELR